MRTPNYPIPLLAELVRNKGKATPDQVLELVSSFGDYRSACSYFEGQVYSLTYERNRLKAENEFLIRLFNVKQEEFDVSRCSGVQAGTLASTGESSSGAVQGKEIQGA